VGAGIIGLASGPAPAATFDASALPTDDLGALPSDDTVPEDSIAPVSPILEGHMPTSVQGSTLTVQSAVDATSLSSGPDGRALNAAMVHLGKDPSELELAYAADESGTLDLTILGFRADGVAASQMQDAVLTTWLASGTPGVETSSVTWSGTEVTKVSYGDEGPDEYLVTLGDSVFVLETIDESVAQAAVAAMVGGAVPASSDAPASSEAPASGAASPAASS
jgi:hypothetical protein